MAVKKRILVVDDEDLIRWSLKEELSREGYSVLTAAGVKEALEQLSRGGLDAAICDLKLTDGSGMDVLKYAGANMPGMPVIIMTAHGDISSAVEAMKHGAAHYISKPFDLVALRMELEKVCETSLLKRRVQETQDKRKRRYNFSSIITESPVMKRILLEAGKMAATESSTVLVHGESGTGKDLLARAIHYEGGRAEMPFMEISCTAIPENLLESELFGYEKGAFTDAKGQKKGFFDSAEGGTVFLNEIGHMPLSLQAKLLRVIEDKTFMRVGGNEELGCDVRIMAATNQDLAEAVEKGIFRKDLYYRLNVLTIELPPLRERREDIIPLTRHFLGRFSREMRRNAPAFSDKAQDIMNDYFWPGNIRELRNLMERVMILGEEKEVSGQWLGGQLGKSPGRTAEMPSGSSFFRLPPDGISLDELEKDFLRQAMEISKGNQVRAAKLLGISRDAFRYRAEKYGLLSV